MVITNDHKTYETPEAKMLTFGAEDVLESSTPIGPQDMIIGGEDKIWGGME